MAGTITPVTPSTNHAQTPAVKPEGVFSRLNPWRRSKNIRAHETVETAIWNPANPVQSLHDVRVAVDREGQNAIDWYWKAKPGKSIPSRAIQFLAVTLTAFAGIIPIVVQILKNAKGAGGFPKVDTGFDSGPLAALCVGAAAGLLGLDTAFGLSSGWTRYVLTATSMTKLLHEFRMDWVALIAVAGSNPTPEQQAALIQRAKDFVTAIQAVVLQETKDWATEFQSNIAQMEKDLKSQLDQLKAQVEKAAKDKDDATKPGSIELTVTNADKTDAFHFSVALEGVTLKLSDTVSNNQVWAHINTPPGQYKLTVSAQAQAKPVAISTVIDVKPADTAKLQLTLPIPTEPR